MLRSDLVTKIALICLILLCLVLSACGSMFTSNRERDWDESACRSKCSGLTGDDHAACLQQCVFEKPVERSRWKDKLEQDAKEEKLRKGEKEREQAEFDKKIMDKILKNRSN